MAVWPADPHFANTEEMIVVWVVVIKNLETAFLDLAVLLVAGQHAIADQVIFFTVGLNGGLEPDRIRDLAQCVRIGLIGQAGIQLDQRFTQITGQDNVLVRLPS